MKRILFVAFGAILTACGGTTQKSDVLAFAGDGPLSLPEINDVGTALVSFGDDVESGVINGVQRSDLVAQGSATYSGYLISEHQADDVSIIGRASVNMTFTGGGSVTGTVDEFVHVDASVFDGPPLTDLDELGSFNIATFADDVAITPIPGLLNLFDGELMEDDEGVGGILIDARGSWTLDETLSSTGNVEVFDVAGDFGAGVGSDGTLIGAGELQAESSDEGFDVDAVLFAR